MVYLAQCLPNHDMDQGNGDIKDYNNLNSNVEL